MQAILEHGDADALEISTRSAQAMLLDLPITDLYVRFLPADSVQMEMLWEMALELFDFPLDFEIVQHGDFFRDPTLCNDALFTWQYTVVKPCFVFPEGIKYEILAELFIPENSEFFTEVDIDPNELEPGTRMASSWEDIQYRNLLQAMLHVSFALTGNADELATPEEVESRSVHQSCVRRCILFVCWTNCTVWYIPQGFIRLSTPDGLIGVQGIRVRVWRWFDIRYAYTDARGFYSFGRFDRLSTGNNLNYKLILRGTNGGVNWKIRQNIGNFLTLWTDSYSLGSGSPIGRNYTFFMRGDRNSNDGPRATDPIIQRYHSLWGTLVYHNAIFDYINQIQRGIGAGAGRLPRNLDIVIDPLPASGGGFQGAANSMTYSNIWLLRTIARLGFDVRLRYRNVRTSWEDMNRTARHELAHISHFERVRTERGATWAGDWVNLHFAQVTLNAWLNGELGGASYYVQGHPRSELIGLIEGWAYYRDRLLWDFERDLNRFRPGLQSQGLTETQIRHQVGDNVTFRNDGFPSGIRRMFWDLNKIGVSDNEMERALAAFWFSEFRDNLIARHPHLRTQITDIVNRKEQWVRQLR